MSAYTDAVEASWPISSTRLDVRRAATVHDAELQQVINYVCNGCSYVVPSHLQAYQQAQGELSIVKGLFVYYGRIVVPVNQRHDILEKLHESQQGLHRCRQRAQRAVWWAGLSRDLEQFIDGCRECRKHRPTQRS